MKPWALLVRLGGIGDNLIASSVLPLLARDYNVEVMTQKPQHVIFENNPHIAKLTVRDQGDLPPVGDQWQAWFAHRGKEYAKWINLSHSCEGMLALFPGQTQFNWPVGWRRKHCNHNYLEFIHEIAEVGAPYEPRFYPTEEEVTHAETTLAKVRGAGGYKHVVGIVLAGSRLDKVWPYLPPLVAKLVRELRVAVVLFGSEQERELAKRVQDFVGTFNGSHQGMHAALTAYEPDGKTLVADWPIRRSLTTLQCCDLVISPDTGLAWGVASEPMPKIMLLSHASPTNITKHWRNTVTLTADPKRVDCWPCHQLHDRIETCRKAENADAAACISDITDETVFLAAKAALQGDNAYGGHSCIQRSAVAELELHHGGGDPTGSLGGRFVLGQPLIDLGL